MRDIGRFEPAAASFVVVDEGGNRAAAAGGKLASPSPQRAHFMRTGIESDRHERSPSNVARTRSRTPLSLRRWALSTRTFRSCDVSTSAAATLPAWQAAKQFPATLVRRREYLRSRNLDQRNPTVRRIRHRRFASSFRVGGRRQPRSNSRSAARQFRVRDRTQILAVSKDAQRSLIRTAAPTAPPRSSASLKSVFQARFRWMLFQLVRPRSPAGKPVFSSATRATPPDSRRAFLSGLPTLCRKSSRGILSNYDRPQDVVPRPSPVDCSSFVMAAGSAISLSPTAGKSTAGVDAPTNAFGTASTGDDTARVRVGDDESP